MILFISFRTFDDLKLELDTIGLNEYNIVIGIDFTISNEWKGKFLFKLIIIIINFLLFN